MLHQRCLKYLTQLLLVPMMMKLRWNIYLKALAVKLIGSSLVKKQFVLKYRISSNKRPGRLF